MEEVGQRQRLGDDHVRVGALDDHVVDLVDAPLAEELLARQDRLALAGEELVEGVQVLVEHLAGRPEGVGRVEVEDVAHAVEDERADLALAPPSAGRVSVVAIWSPSSGLGQPSPAVGLELLERQGQLLAGRRGEAVRRPDRLPDHPHVHAVDALELAEARREGGGHRPRTGTSPW